LFTALDVLHWMIQDSHFDAWHYYFSLTIQNLLELRGGGYYYPANHRDHQLIDPGIIPSQGLSRQRHQRDQRLDFWRGLCLIDMALVHLVYQNVQFGQALGNFIGSYSRFAAGGFIFIAGLGVGMIFLPRARDDNRRGETYRSLFSRAIYILCVQYLCAMGMLSLEVFRGARVSAGNPLVIWRDIFFLREGGDLLPFYVVMVGLSPLALELFRRGRGWIVLLISGILFLIGLCNPWLFAIATHDNFPPILWQILFVLGLALGSNWKRYDALQRRYKLLLAGVAWNVFALLFVSEYSSYFGWPALSLGLSFSKVPLSTGEALRYLCLVGGILTTTDVMWPTLQGGWFARFAQTLGRKSLPVYVLHLWLVEIAGSAAAAWWWIGRWQILFAVATLGILWCFARTLEWRARVSKSRRVDSGPAPVHGAISASLN